MKTPHPEDVARVQSTVNAGGVWRPPHCTARQKIAIIIPFRDRDKHLSILLQHLHPFLQRQGLDYQIFVIEQVSLLLDDRMFLAAVILKCKSCEQNRAIYCSDILQQYFTRLMILFI